MEDLPLLTFHDLSHQFWKCLFFSKKKKPNGSCLSPRHIFWNCEAICFQDLLAITDSVIASTPVLSFRSPGKMLGTRPFQTAGFKKSCSKKLETRSNHLPVSAPITKPPNPTRSLLIDTEDAGCSTLYQF